MTDLLSDLQGLIILGNMTLAFIAGMLILFGWHMTTPRPQYVAEAKVLHALPPLLRRIQRVIEEQSGTCALSGAAILSRGHVLPNERSYMFQGETLPLPSGLTLRAGREVALVALSA